jgi:hypothetical protein
VAGELEVSRSFGDVGYVDQVRVHRELGSGSQQHNVGHTYKLWYRQQTCTATSTIIVECGEDVVTILVVHTCIVQLVRSNALQSHN